MKNDNIQYFGTSNHINYLDYSGTSIASISDCIPINSILPGEKEKLTPETLFAIKESQQPELLKTFNTIEELFIDLDE